MINEIRVERNSPSDTELVCVKISDSRDDWISTGDVIMEFEGAKSIFEIETTYDGFFYPLIAQGDLVEIGQLVALVSRAKLTESELNNYYGAISKNKNNTTIDTSVSLQITDPARKLAFDLQIDLSDLSNLPNLPEIIDSEFIKIYANSKSASELTNPKWNDELQELKGKRPLVIVGGGLGAFQVLDILLEVSEFEPVGYIANFVENAVDSLGIKNLGSIDENNLKRISVSFNNVAFVNSVGSDPDFRISFARLSEKLNLDVISLIHKSSHVSKMAEIGTGSVIFANVFIGAEAKLGKQCFISSNSTIEHHVSVGEGFCCGPGFNSSGNVSIGNAVRVGTGVFVEPRLNIGSNSVIASGSIITRDIPANTIVKSENNFSIRQK